MRFKGLDLNLLVALDILLSECSVSRAARRLHISQPAASAALGRLRDYFGDELLIQHGKRMIPTSYADSLVPEVRRVLENVDAIILRSSSFDPASSQRVFKLMASDYIAAVLVGPTIKRFAEIAPNIRLNIRLPSERVAVEFERGEVDITLTPEEYTSPNHPAELLFEEQHVVVGWDQNPLLQSPLSNQDFLNSEHVAVTIGPDKQPTYAERHLNLLARERMIEIYAPSFAVVPWLIIGTRRLSVMHRRLAQLFADNLPLKSSPLPLDVPPMKEMLQYHTAREQDAGLLWLRRQLHITAMEATA